MGLPYTEQDIEALVMKMLARPTLGYDVICCYDYTGKKVNFPDGTGRASTVQCVLPEILEQSLVRINPGIDKAVISEIVADLSQDFPGYNTVSAYSVFGEIIRSGIKLPTQNGNGAAEIVKLVDFDNPDNNSFVAVSQMRVRFNKQTRRPDIVVFVNGMPFVLVELKQCNQDVLKAYEKNLKVYVHDIPNLFVLNQFCVLSNVLDTRVGSFNSPYEKFCEFLKSDRDGKAKPSLQEIEVILERLLQGLLQKNRLLDYISNLANLKPYQADIGSESEEVASLGTIATCSVAAEEELPGDYSSEEVVFIMEEAELNEDIADAAPSSPIPHLGLIFKDPTNIVLLW